MTATATDAAMDAAMGNYLLMMEDWGITAVSSVASHRTAAIPVELAEDRPALAAYIGWMDSEPGS